MTNFIHDKSLKTDNTFGILAFAKHYVEVQNDLDIIQLTNSTLFQKNKHLILGMGADILFTSDFDGLIIKSSINDIVVEKGDKDYVYVKVGSGIIWNNFVHHALEKSWYGIENLIDIPGTCGGTVVQNIGAYGMEVKNVVNKVRAYRLIPPKSFIELSNEECKFSYRNSIFKEKDFMNNYLITEITYKLPKEFTPTVKYKDVEQTLSDRNISSPTAKDIAGIISELRKNKLPDYTKIGNAGSFFKNPVVLYEDFKDTIDNYYLKIFPVDDRHCKLSAAQLIELAGFKGKREGDAGVYDKHALILCNYGDATGEEIYKLALLIIEKVKMMFGITLSPEVIVW